MIQAKAQTIDLNDNANNSANLKKALKSLANADEKNVQYLFYATNMLNPINTPTKEFENYDLVTKMYNELSIESKKKIDKQIENLKGVSIDKDKLVIIRIPFFGNFNEEKYKFIDTNKLRKMELIISIFVGIIFLALLVCAIINKVFIPAALISFALLLFCICYYYIEDESKKKLVYILFGVGVLLIIIEVIYTLVNII